MNKILYNADEIQSLLDSRPSPCYTHTTRQEPAIHWKTIEPGNALHFDKYTTFGKSELAITLGYKDAPTTELTHNGTDIAASLDNAKVSNHNVRLTRNDVHFSIVEHIMGILTATNHIVHIETQ